ncbi:MAG: type II toxin-antitoxin system RelE/ParE family toxin [Proteobacteria bacterium]|nr:type II toxin-antitoxin system RelE/ParE family toxin [Pseudomonadota bacterium]
MQDLNWLLSSKKDLMTFPTEVRQEIGFALYVAQEGETHHSAKLFKGLGSGIYEIVVDYNKDTFRAVYVVNLNKNIFVNDSIYVLHVFQKKSKKGIKTPMKDLNIIKQRLKFLKAELTKGGMLCQTSKGS